MPKITFIVNGKERVADAQTDQNILEAAQNACIPMESACGGNGFCMTCKCRVRKGADQLSPPNDREEAMGVTGDERLGCQAHIKGDVTVEIES